MSLPRCGRAERERQVVRRQGRPCSGITRRSPSGVRTLDDRRDVPRRIPVRGARSCPPPRGRDPPPSLMEQLQDEDGRGLVRAVKRVLPAGDASFSSWSTSSKRCSRSWRTRSSEHASSTCRTRGRRSAQPAQDRGDAPRRLLRPAAPVQRVRGASPRLRRGARPAHSGRVRTGDRGTCETGGRLARGGPARGDGHRRRHGTRRAPALAVRADRVVRAAGGHHPDPRRISRDRRRLRRARGSGRRGLRWAHGEAQEGGEAAVPAARRARRRRRGHPAPRRARRAGCDGSRPGRLDQAIEAFGSSRLLSFDRDPRTGTPTIEVAHEALLREWAGFAAGSTQPARTSACIAGSPPRRASGTTPTATRASSCAAATSRNSSPGRVIRASR